ncbi:MAG: pyridoxamine 5'-phosphate oxidase family protein, partial [Acidimicrobiales bacterium]
MNETAEDIEELQALLDASYAASGEHLREVITSERRLSVEEVAAALTGMRLLVLATVTRDGRPVAGPVDGIFYRGRFYFGSSPESVRFKHIAARPWVSATHLPGEELS